jgi:hypothetical protein
MACLRLLSSGVTKICSIPNFAIGILRFLSLFLTATSLLLSFLLQCRHHPLAKARSLGLLGFWDQEHPVHGSKNIFPGVNL